MKNETIKAYELSYYFIIKDCLKMLEQKQYQKKDFKNLCNSIICMLSINNNLDDDTKQVERELFKKLKNMGYYENI